MASFARRVLHYTFLPTLVFFRVLSICLCLNKRNEKTEPLEGLETEDAREDSLGLQLKQMRDSLVREIRLAGSPPSKTSPATQRYFRQENGYSADVDESNPDSILLLQAAKTVSWVQKVYWFQALHLLCVGIFKVSGMMEEHNLELHRALSSLASWHQGLYTVVVLLTVAFRNDYPFNLIVVLSSLYFCGWVHGMKQACAQ